MSYEYAVYADPLLSRGIEEANLAATEGYRLVQVVTDRGEFVRIMERSHPG